MTELGIARGPVRETRAAYTDAITSALVEAASGTGSTTAVAVASLEAAAGLWQRAFQAATVTPAGSRTASLTPAILGLMARELCRRGNSVFALDVQGGELRLLPAWSWDVRGGVDPATWRYRLTLAGPTATETRPEVPADAVLHLMYAVDAVRPWSGLGPLGVANQSGRLAGEIEKALADEARGPRGTLITTPEASGAADDADGEVIDPYAEIRADLAKLAGNLALVESFASGGGDRGLRPDRDWKPERLGADPPPGLVTLRAQVADAVLSACGVPPGLMSGTAAATLREGFRIFYRSTLLPLARAVEVELSRALDVPVALDFSRLGAADIATAARAYKALVEAGMGDGDARRFVGLAR